MLKIAEYAERGSELTNRALDALKIAGVDYSFEDYSGSAVRLVFAGQYSAGKSSIIKMLTGDQNIETGAGITTQEVQTYKWNGMEIIDTPGVHSEKRPDHDLMSYEAISSADMLVFVITNELFDSHLAEHFRKLAIAKEKACEMILVVNKMERSNEGNCDSQQQIIREDLKNVIAPYSAEQLYLCFLDAESYLESLDEADPEIAEELKNRSGYSSFVETLNRFVCNKGLLSRLTTSLYQVAELLQKGIHELEPKADDADVDALKELYLQQRHVLIEGRYRLQKEIQDIFTSAASQVRNIGNDAADLIIEGCNQDEVEEELAQQIQKADVIIEDCQRKAVTVLEKRLNEIGQAQSTIEQSEFAQELAVRLSIKYESLPENLKRLLINAGPGLQKAGLYIAEKAYKAGGKGGGLKLASFSGGTVHEIVLKAGKAIGFKFKPWQAVKIAKGIGVAGKALGILGVGLNAFMQIKADYDDDRMRNELQKSRQNIRSQFRAAAAGLVDFGKVFVEKNVTEALDQPIHELDESIQEICSLKETRNQSCQTLEILYRECLSLIQDIHSIA